MHSRIEKNIPVFSKDQIGHISDIYIEKAYRGKGYGSKMFEETMEWFCLKGITEVSLKVMCYNPNARKVYDSWGFKDIHIMMRKEMD